jgi:hypothetical protein
MIGTGNLSLSWTRSGSMIPPITSPVALYQQLFVEDTAEGRAESLRRLQRDRSLLDGMKDQFKALQQRVGANDRERLDQFATAIRDLESSLAASESWLNRPKPKTTTAQPKDIADVNDFKANARAMLDLVRLALETDSTRIVTVCLSTGNLTPKGIAGVSSGTHPLTHHGRQPEKIAELRRIEEAHFQSLAAFFDGLSATNEQDKPLLDHTACNDNLPTLLVGGSFKHAGHLAFDHKSNYPLSNLHVSLLQSMGLEMDTFSSGRSTMRGLELG